jgi:hypothetical protein
VCLLVRRLIDSIAVSHVVEGHYDVRPAPIEGRARRFIDTVFGIPPYFLIPSRFRARHLRDKVFLPLSRRSSHRIDQEY